MNDHEYNAIRKKVSATFPSLRQWFDGLDESSQAGIRDRWRSILIGCDKIAIEDAIGELAKSLDDPWPYDRDRERAAAIIAAKARESAFNKRERAKSTPQSTEPRKSRQSHANAHTDAITANIATLIEADLRHDDDCKAHRRERGRCRPGCEVPRLVAREYCDRTESRHDYAPEPRYSCHMCRDLGAVSIVAPEVVAEYATAGRITHPWGASVRCNCAAGQQKPWLAAFDSRRHVRLDLYDELAVVDACRKLVSGANRREVAFDRFNETVGVGF